MQKKQKKNNNNEMVNSKSKYSYLNAFNCV